MKAKPMKPQAQPKAEPTTTAAPAQPIAAQPQATTCTSLAVVEYGEEAGAGLENITADERTIPFITILQSNSPQCDASKPGPKSIEGSKAGQIMKTSSNELFEALWSPGKPQYENAIGFIPCLRDHKFVEREPRGANGTGGGFIGIRDPKDPATKDLIAKLQAEQGKFKPLDTSEGTVLIDTYYLFGLFEPEPDFVFPGCISFKSTQIPYYKKWLDNASNIKYPNSKGIPTNPPLYAQRWTVQSMPDQNKKGSYFSWRIQLANGATPLRPLAARIERTEPLYTIGAELYQALMSGRATIKHEAEDTSAPKDDDIPF